MLLQERGKLWSEGHRFSHRPQSGLALPSDPPFGNGGSSCKAPSPSVSDGAKLSLIRRRKRGEFLKLNKSQCLGKVTASRPNHSGRDGLWGPDIWEKGSFGEESIPFWGGQTMFLGHFQEKKTATEVQGRFGDTTQVMLGTLALCTSEGLVCQQLSRERGCWGRSIDAGLKASAVHTLA